MEKLKTTVMDNSTLEMTKGRGTGMPIIRKKIKKMVLLNHVLKQAMIIVILLQHFQY
jgi:hypothetical protein